jgi:hypothetical protein
MQEIIRICVDVRLSHIQGIALVAALKEVFCPGGRKKGACFSCRKGERFARDCQNKPRPQVGISGPITRPLTGANGPRARPAAPPGYVLGVGGENIGQMNVSPKQI